MQALLQPIQGGHAPLRSCCVHTSIALHVAEWGIWRSEAPHGVRQRLWLLLLLRSRLVSCKVRRQLRQLPCQICLITATVAGRSVRQPCVRG